MKSQEALKAKALAGQDSFASVAAAAAIAENGVKRGGAAVTVRKEEDWVEKYLKITRRLILSPFSKPFREPVAPEDASYHQIIDNPISLKEIAENLETGKYESVSKVEAAYWLMFNNCFLFNPPSSPVFVAGYQLQLEYETERESEQPVKIQPHAPTPRIVKDRTPMTALMKERLSKSRAGLLLYLLEKRDKLHVLTEDWDSRTLPLLKYPIRLANIHRQLKANGYGTNLSFYVDVNIMLLNVLHLYPSHSEKHTEAQNLLKLFEEMWTKSEKELQEIKSEYFTPMLQVIEKLSPPPSQATQSTQSTPVVSKRKATEQSTPPPSKKFKTPQSSSSSRHSDMEDPNMLAVSRQQRAKNFAKRVSEHRKQASGATDLESPKETQLVPKLLDSPNSVLKCESCIQQGKCCLFHPSDAPSKCIFCKRRKLHCSTAALVHAHLLSQKSSWKGPWIAPQILSHAPKQAPPPENTQLPPRKWNVEQVCEWLERNGLGELKSFFQENAINGKKLFRLELTDLSTFNEKPRNKFLSLFFSLNSN